MNWTKTMANLIGLFSPRAAMEYSKGRDALRRYHGASIAGHTAGWRPLKNQSQDAILKLDGPMLVARARDLVRNNVHAAGAIRTIVDQVVSTGIKPQAMRRKSKGGDLYQAANDALEAAWHEWARAERFHWLQRLVLRHWIVDGECLVQIWIDPKRTKDGICPLRLTVLEPELLDETVDDGDRKRRGIELDKHGDPIAYHIRTRHPGDSYNAESRRIPASEILHIFTAERASQTRGVSMLAPVVEAMHDLDEYQHSERIAARLAAAFGIFIKSPWGQGVDGSVPMGQGIGTDGSLEGVPDYIEPGRIQPLPPGMEIQVADSSRPGSTYEPYVKTSLKGLSVGFGLKYGTFSNDYTDSSYSSERSAALDERRRWEVMQAGLIDLLCRPVWSRWEEIAASAGLIRYTGSPVVWQAPKWPWVDPLKDANAARVQLELGVTSRHRICSALGLDYDEIHQDLVRERERRLKDGLETEEFNGSLYIDDKKPDDQPEDL